jgi:tetratricopeptide (TPR) repeat protein
MTSTLTEALRELLATARRACAESPDARVVGERVKVRAVELLDGTAPTLIAEVVRRGVAHRISLADLQAEEGSAFADVVARYRELCGWSESASPRPGSSSAAPPIEAGGVAEVAILSVKPTAARCRPVGSTATFTLRTTGLHRLVPGEIARTRIRKSWRHAGHPYASGEVAATTLDVARLGLVPLRLEPQGDWDPQEEYWGEEGEPLPSWARAIVARGVRPAFEMEQVIPDADPEDWESDPIIDAAELNESGDHAGARALLMKQLEQDLRCLDAHAHLGNWLLDHWPDDALRHYEAGVRIGELSLPRGFDGLLPWGLTDNRPFLRCLHGYGLALWRLGRAEEASAVFQRMLWLNPSDNQGARILLEQVDAGLTWAAAEAEDAAANAAAFGSAATRGPPRGGEAAVSMRRVPVDLGELAEALEDNALGHDWCLDLETGDVIPVFEDLEDDLLPVPREELEESPRFLNIPPRPSRDGWRDMADFVATVDDRALRQRLADAIEGKGAFGRFKKILQSAPAERDRWFEWEGERLKEEARAWLASEGIEAVPRAKA